MDKDINEETKVVLFYFFLEGKDFTAYDVTKRLRELGLSVKHCEVREQVHTLFKNGNFPDNYTKGYIEFDNGDSAILYKFTNPDEEEDTVDDKDICDENDNKPSAPEKTCLLVSPDNRGRVNIPASFILSAGLNPSDIIIAACNFMSPNETENRIILGRKNEVAKHVDITSKDSIVSNYKIDCYSNVKLSKSFLNSCGILVDKNNISISLKDNVIIVKNTIIIK